MTAHAFKTHVHRIGELAVITYVTVHLIATLGESIVSQIMAWIK